jgi:hypothetical protein
MVNAVRNIAGSAESHTRISSCGVGS